MMRWTKIEQKLYLSPACRTKMIPDERNERQEGMWSKEVVHIYE